MEVALLRLPLGVFSLGALFVF